MKKLFLPVLLFFMLTACSGSAAISLSGLEGVFDAKIGNDELIISFENAEQHRAEGFYIFKRNNAVEDAIPFTIKTEKGKTRFVSDEIEGDISHFSFSDIELSGRLKLTKNRSWLFFWRNRVDFDMNKRAEVSLPDVSRFRTYISTKINITHDIVYGNAKGYWTETPYIDEPYIRILGRGMSNLFRGLSELDLKLDIYSASENIHKPAPFVLLIHGGGFYIGNRKSPTVSILAEEFARRGYVVASMDYRMGFRLRAADIERSAYRTVQDVHAALRYMAHHAEDYGIDPGHIYVAGTSAGAIASLKVAYLDDHERPESTYDSRWRDDMGGVSQSGNNYNGKFQIKGIGNMWGAVMDTAIICTEKKIPVISFHGTNDDVVPIDYGRPFNNTLGFNRLLIDYMYGSRSIHEQLNRMDIPNKLVEFEGEGHEPQLDLLSGINSNMDTISFYLISFFNNITYPSIRINDEVLTVNAETNVVPFDLEIENGEFAFIDVEGGFKLSDKPGETGIIWIKQCEEKFITVYAKNHFDAWDFKRFYVDISNQY
jgi:predicted esterase